MTAASPGTIAVFQPNEYYPSHEAYLQALAEAMREEYETIVKSGLVLQIDCPDLAMGRHIRFRNADDDEFVRNAAIQVEAHEPCARQRSRRSRAFARLLGELRRTAHPRHSSGEDRLP